MARRTVLMGIVFGIVVVLGTACSSTHKQKAANKEILEPFAFFDRGNKKREKGDLSGAIADFTEAIRLNPDFGSAYYNRGNVRAEQGDVEGAEKDYFEALRNRSDWPEVHFNLGALYLNAGDTQSAINSFDEVIRLDPDSSNAFLYRGMAKGFQNETQGAMEDLDQAIDLDPRNENALVVRGRMRVESFESTIRVQRFFLGVPEDGVYQDERGLLPLAIKDLEQALDLNQQSWKAWLYHAIALARQGRHGESNESFDKALEHAPPKEGNEILRLRQAAFE